MMRSQTGPGGLCEMRSLQLVDDANKQSASRLNIGCHETTFPLQIRTRLDGGHFLILLMRCKSWKTVSHLLTWRRHLKS